MDDSTTTQAASGEKRSGMTFESLAVVSLVFGVFAILISVFALGLAARAVSEAKGGGGTSSGSGSAAPATAEVSAKEFAFSPDEIKISATGTITLTNKGTVAHDLVVQGLTTGSVDPGKTGTLTLKDIKAGEYEYYCSVAGHRDAGMKGRILVG